jgi:superfamily I DNA/RNA helicase
MYNNQVMYPTDSICEITAIEEETFCGFEGFNVVLNDECRVFLPKKQYEVNIAMKRYAKEKNWHEYFELKNKVGDLRAIHACTVHKSQGSTYDNVFIDLDSIGRNNKANEVARLLYVAITRASNMVYLYGSLPSRYLP